MVAIGLSAKKIRRYLHQFLLWWTTTIESWTYPELVTWFVERCHDIRPAAYAAGVLQRYLNKLGEPMFCMHKLLRKV